MKKIFLTILFLFYCAYPFRGHAERAEFVSGFEDLPLMPGLQEHDDTGVSFDTPGGRIIEAYAETLDTDEPLDKAYDHTFGEF